MEITSFLYPEALYQQSQTAYLHIFEENLSYKDLRDSLQKVIDSYSQGVAIDSYKQYAEDFCLVLDKLIEANELDMSDHEAIGEALRTILTDKVEMYEVLKGEEIVSNILILQSSIDTYNNLINEYLASADSAWWPSSVWYNDEAEKLAAEVEEMKDSLEKYEYKQQRYDEIEIATSGLFQNSVEIRQLAWAALQELVIEDGEYVPSADSTWKAAFTQLDIKRDYGELYNYLIGLIDVYGNQMYTEEEIVNFINYMKTEKPAELSSLSMIKVNCPENYQNELNYIASLLLNKTGKLQPNVQYSDDCRTYEHPNCGILFVPNQHGGYSDNHVWNSVQSDGGSYLDESGCYYFSAAAALSYISGQSVDMAYFLQCCGYEVDMSNPNSFTVSPSIESLASSGSKFLPLTVDGNKVNNTQWDVVISNATGLDVTQTPYEGSVAGWEYPTDISNVCYIVRQQNGGLGPIDTSGKGHWVCIFPIGNNEYQVINYNSKGAIIITHDQLTALTDTQYELSW